MLTGDYKKTWDQIHARRNELQERKDELEQERAALEADLSEAENEIAHLDEVLAHLGPLAGIPRERGSVVGMGLTEAVLSVLGDFQFASPNDIYERLDGRGFSFVGYTKPMASVYKTLSRLHEKGQLEIKKEGNRIFYKLSRDISDEDIPF